MKTGTLMFDIEIETEDLLALQSKIKKAIKGCSSEIKDVECVDGDIQDDEEDSES